MSREDRLGDERGVRQARTVRPGRPDGIERGAVQRDALRDVPGRGEVEEVVTDKVSQADETIEPMETLDRTKYIGSSDAAMVADLSPWGSPLTVWNRMVGLTSPDEGEKPLRFWLGKQLEPIVLELYRQRTGLLPDKVLDDDDPPMLYPENERIGAHPDYEQLEIKTSRSAYGWGDDEETVTVDNMAIPLHYFLQVQHQLMVTGWKVMDVAVLIGHDEFRRYSVPRDKTIITGLLATELELLDYVDRGEPPPKSDAAARKAYLRAKFPTVEGPMRPATPEEERIVRDWRDAHFALGDAKIKDEMTADRVRRLIGPAEGLIGLVTWKTQVHHSIDTEALRRELKAIDRLDILASVTRATPTRVLRKIGGEDE